ncbi:ATP-binding protein [uncultured Parolsenella sp.]|uniref:sensor histidine kinase n=1 Tax=uncultured Parolsenella sp. TaxID=2083008 RepID=UPI0025CF464F|nr:ATP-binding protein [uncultured Parolsenella sp.]
MAEDATNGMMGQDELPEQVADAVDDGGATGAVTPSGEGGADRDALTVPVADAVPAADADVDGGATPRRVRALLCCGRKSLARRIFVSLAAVSAIAAVAVLVIASLVYQKSGVRDAGRMLETECALVKTSMRGTQSDIIHLTNLDLGEARVTVVSPDGTVLYDNQNSVDSMPNHADRPEIAGALETGKGSAERDSATSGRVEIYRAVRLDNGNVLRLAVARDGIRAALGHDVLLAVAVVTAVVLVCWAVSRLIVDRLVEPILDIDPSNPDPEGSYVELEPLVERIDEQMGELRGADLMRREFTSNVTHELKTPLSTISGAAELIRDGIAKPEDVPEFAGRIVDEAHHMTDLVNDILTLSKLDESERAGDTSLLGKAEPVDIAHALREVGHRLAPVADAAGVRLTCSGDPVVVRGIPSLLDELVYNLCDNAVRYNHAGGTVDAHIDVVDGCPRLVVADTGLGIPEAAQAKVFERFYRVDASRSRERGGTGLGLAIVKHAAAYHGAKLTLESKEGVGTTVTVTFPESSLVEALG